MFRKSKEKESPRITELEEGEFVIKSQKGYKLKESALVTAFTFGALDIGTWYITNKRLIYEGPKKGKKDLVATAFGGLLGKMLAREMETVSVRHDEIESINIRPYGKIDKTLEVTYHDNGKTKSLYIGLPLIDRSKFEVIKECLEKAPYVTSFCKTCGNPLVKDEAFCPKCGTKRE